MKPLSEQTILITGATDGLGKATAHALAAQEANVVLHGRDPQRLEATRREIQEATGNDRLETYLADLVALDQVRRLAAQVQADHPQLDVLINNAGVGGGPADHGQARRLSQDGYELIFAVNYLAPFLLTHLLLPTLRASRPARIVNVSSTGQSALDLDDVMSERHHDAYRAYTRSKLAQVMFTIDLAGRLEEQVTVNCVHPASLMDTRMVRESFGYTLSTVDEGVRSVMYVATSPALERVTGKYFDHEREARADPQAYDPAARRRLWELSEKLTGLAEGATDVSPHRATNGK